MLNRLEWRDFAAVVCSIAVVGLGLGSSLPLTALVLSQRGYSMGVIGWMIAASAAGGVVGTIAAPAMAARFGRRHVMLGCLGLGAISVFPLQYVSNIAAWTFLRIASGAAMAPLFVLGEAWINELSGDAVRGRIVAIYTTSFTLCQVAGPLLAQVLTHFPSMMFIGAGAIFSLGAPGIALAGEQRGSIPVNGGASLVKNSVAGWLQILRQAPGIIAGAALFAAFDSVVLSFLPLTALGYGLSQALALSAVSITFAGDATLQIVAGALADKFGRARVQLICALLLCLILPLLPLMLRTQLLWPIYLFLLGGIAGSIYTLALVASGEQYSGAALVRASGLIALTWNFAATAAPAASGIAARWLGNSAWVPVLWAMSAGFLLIQLASARGPWSVSVGSPKSRRLAGVLRSPPGADVE